MCFCLLPTAVDTRLVDRVPVRAAASQLRDAHLVPGAHLHVQDPVGQAAYRRAQDEAEVRGRTREAHVGRESGSYVRVCVCVCLCVCVFVCVVI